MTEPHDDVTGDLGDEPVDELIGRLRSIDPVLVEPPPRVGSTRFTSIKDIAMSNSTSLQDTVHNDTPSTTRFERRRPLAIAAAVLVALAVGASFLIPGSTSSAAAEVEAAVASTAEVTDFRVTLVSDNLGFPGGSAEGQVDGDNLYLIAGPLEFYRVGDTEWVGENGQFASMPSTESFDPFGEASQAVLTAALESKDVDGLGEVVVNGVATEHFVIGIDDDAAEALAAVSPTSQFWFVGNVSEEVVEGDAEPRRSGFLEDAESIDVWVADGLIHQIAVDSGSSRFTWTFSDFGEDIVITPPN